MAYWGIALAVGPNYNLPIDDERAKIGYEAIQTALKLAPNARERERAYIEALSKRYSTEPISGQKKLDEAYADAMREVMKQYPDDLDAATLFASSMMELRPWDLWTKDGKPQPGTEEIVSALQGVLARNPDHPGANHFYIHAVEASPNPGLAMLSARKLPKLAPGAGHLVHMPAHIYIRVGAYDEAALANERAIEVDKKYIESEKPTGAYTMMYYPHNIHFLWAAAAMEGRSAEAIKAARDLRKHLTPEAVVKMPMSEFMFPTLYFALARFEKWDEILNEPAPPASLPYSTGMWHYARGLAFTATKRVEGAETEARELARIAVTVPSDLMEELNSAPTLLLLACRVLEAKIAEAKGQNDEAIRHYKEAIKLEDTLNYAEPPSWYYPVRQPLGAMLLAAGKAPEAETVFSEDLKNHPENGWSLFGLAESLKRQGKTKEAEEAEGRLKKAWERADVELSLEKL